MLQQDSEGEVSLTKGNNTLVFDLKVTNEITYNTTTLSSIYVLYITWKWDAKYDILNLRQTTRYAM